MCPHLLFGCFPTAVGPQWGALGVCPCFVQGFSRARSEEVRDLYRGPSGWIRITGMPNGGLQTDCFLMLTWTDRVSRPPSVWMGWIGSHGECFFTQMVLFLRDPLWGGCLVWVLPCSTDAARAQEMETALLHDLLGGQLHVCCPHLGVTGLLTNACTGPSLLVFPIPR